MFKNADGSFMVEIIIVLGIIIILSNILLLDLDIIYRIKLNKEALELKRDIDGLRMDSLSRGTRSSFLIGKNKYYLKTKNKFNSQYSVKKSVVPETFELRSKEQEYIFTVTGAPAQGGTIQLIHRYGNWDISISPVTGKTNLKKDR